jgi:hypothetical protein
MLDRLRGGQEACVQSGRILELLHHLLAFLDDADDGVAGLPARRLVDFFEHLLEPRDVLVSLGLVEFELCGLRHLGKGAQDFLLSKVDVLEHFVKQFPEGSFRWPWPVASLMLHGEQDR